MMSHIFQEAELKPYASGVPLNGEGMPPLKTVDDWIRYMMTVRERFGSTVMIGKFEMKWGASALWGVDSYQKEIDQLKEEVAWQKKKVNNLRAAKDRNSA